MNITIRKMQPGDADALYRLLSDPEVMRHLEPPFDRETVSYTHLNSSSQICTRASFASSFFSIMLLLQFGNSLPETV